MLVATAKRRGAGGHRFLEVAWNWGGVDEYRVGRKPACGRSLDAQRSALHAVCSTRARQSSQKPLSLMSIHSTACEGAMAQR